MFSPRNDKKDYKQMQKVTLGKWKEKFRSQKKVGFEQNKVLGH